jgi:hypothetical protein
MNKRSGRALVRRFAVVSLAVAAVPAAAFLLLEGGSSLLLFLGDLLESEPPPPLARLLHTRHDPDLGWANIPGVRVEDLYGPGVWLQTNDQGFRAERNFSKQVPPGRLRVICSGDSFTLGYGVANDQTWCAKLEALDPRFESVNMGQGGYGLDQAYLWYRRDGTRLDHDVHIVAFIFDDFQRMQERTFLGYEKPVLAVRDGELVVDNVPVPRRPFYAAWRDPLQRITADLRTSELLRRLVGRSRNESAAIRQRAAERDRATWSVVRKVIDELVAANRAKQSQLVLVHLPTPGDFRQGISDPWRRFAKREAEQRGLPYLDLVAGLRRMPEESIESLFIAPGAMQYRAAAGHLTPKGNEWVARELYDSLAAQPAIEARLQALGEAREQSRSEASPQAENARPDAP